ncbi:MAG: hypothetical protein HUJ58_03175, partial [Erysipelotrichaceae bacterium]|nr:hypothetical protein [Erysipelotrichaceae bacterium]
MDRKTIEKVLFIVGAALICVGLFIRVPGTALTTHSDMDGKKVMGLTFSTIDEYVGGDAYNYIIGASLVGGRIAGARAERSIYISAGAIIIAMGLYLKATDQDSSAEKKDRTSGAVAAKRIINTAGVTADSLLERAYMFLEDGKWDDADAYCDAVLDIEPKNSEAYLGKLMAELQAGNKEKLADCAVPFDEKENYRKAICYGDDECKKELQGYIAHINERNETAGLNRI